MYTLRPIRAWVEFHSATRAYQLYLRCQACLSDQPAAGSTARRWQEQRLYWSCYKSECELRTEMDIPDSLLADFRYPDLYPSPPSAPEHEVADTGHIAADVFAGPWNPRRPDTINNQHESSWFYYLTEITLRRLCNRVLNIFYKEGTAAWTVSAIPTMVKMATEFEMHLNTWFVSASFLKLAQHEFLQIKYDLGSNSFPGRYGLIGISARAMSWGTWSTGALLRSDLRFIDPSSTSLFMDPLATLLWPQFSLLLKRQLLTIFVALVPFSSVIAITEPGTGFAGSLLPPHVS